MFYGKGAGSLATGSAVVSDLLNVALFFESNLHTLPPHFELKTEETKEMMDGAEPVVIQEKSNYYIVISNNNKSLEKVEYDIKRNYHSINRCNLLRGIKILMQLSLLE